MSTNSSNPHRSSKLRRDPAITVKTKNSAENFNKMKRDKSFLSKVVIRRLPPTMTEEQFIEQFSPLPEHDYLYFVKADMRLGMHAFSHAYVNFVIPEEIFLFKERFDGYVFLDSKGNEYPAVVEFAPFQKIPKKRNPKKRDNKCGTILSDPDYLKFLETLKNPDDVVLPSAEVYLEEIETREKELKANNGVPKMTTPLIEYLKARKIEQQKIREEKREERKRKELEKKRLREEERRKRKAEKDKERSKEKENLPEKETPDAPEESASDVKSSEPVVQVLKNPEREKDQKEVTTPSSKSKDFFVPSRTKEKERVKKDWERIRPKDRPKAPVRGYFNEKDRSSRRDKTDYKLYSGKKQPESESSTKKHKEESQKDPEGKDPPKTDQTSKPEKKTEVDKSSSSSGGSQWSSKDKRDNSCPGNVETGGSSQKEKNELSSKQYKTSSKSVTGDINDVSKSDSSSADYRDQGKDPRAERRIRNKDRPAMEIYRPGMRRFSAQRSSPQKEISTSASNSSSPSPTPPLATGSSSKDEETKEKKTSPS